MDRQLNCNFLDADGRRVPAGTKVFTDFQIDNHENGPRFGGRVEEDGRLIFRFTEDAPTGGANVEVMIAGGQVWRGRQTAPGFDHPAYEGDTIRLVREVGLDNPFDGVSSIGELSIDGKFFLESGVPFTAIGISQFNLYNRYLMGDVPTVYAVLTELRALRFNFARVWTLMQLSQFGIGDLLDPQYPRMPGFVSLCAAYGIHVEFTAYTGINDPEHWRRLCEASSLCRPRPLVSGINEYDVNGWKVDAQGRRFDLAWITPPADPALIWSKGSNGGGAETILPVGRYGEYHTNLQSEWWRKVGHNAMEQADTYGVPILTNENERYSDNESSPTRAYDAAKASALLNVGCDFHCREGKLSIPLAESRVAAAEWARGMHDMPLKYQRGRYNRVDDPAFLRVYQRILSDGDTGTAEIRR